MATTNIDRPNLWKQYLTLILERIGEAKVYADYYHIYTESEISLGRVNSLTIQGPDESNLAYCERCAELDFNDADDGCAEYQLIAETLIETDDEERGEQELEAKETIYMAALIYAKTVYNRNDPKWSMQLEDLTAQALLAIAQDCGLRALQATNDLSEFDEQQIQAYADKICADHYIDIDNLPDGE